jgi:uncharacterized membrane protein
MGRCGAIQYSALPSLVGVFLDAGRQNEAGDALFNAVYAHWSFVGGRCDVPRAIHWYLYMNVDTRRSRD